MPSYDKHLEGLPSSPTRRQLIFGTVGIALLASCVDPDSGFRKEPTPTPAALTGAIYAGTNKLDGNSIAVFTRDANGMLAPLAEYLTGGLGGVFDGANDGLDPLISEDSIVAVDDRFVLAVNPGSNTIASLRINSDFTLTLIGTVPTGGVGPISIAHRNGIVYVANVDTDGAFAGPPDQSGSITGFRFDLNSGQLTPIPGSTRNLGNRPSDVEFSPDGRLLVVSSVNAGSAMLTSRNTAELTSFGVRADGNLTSGALGTAASTLPGNAAGRNLPTAIGFEIVERGGRNIVISSEAREFLPDGRPGMLTMFQTGSVSTWELNGDGSFSPRS